MFPIFQRKLYKNWLMILGWGIGLGLLGYYIFTILDNIFQRDVDLMQLFNAFPEDLLAFFGGNVNIFSLSGFLHLEFFSYMPIILGIMVVSAASSLVSKDEEEGVLELILAQSVSRSAVFFARFLALVVSVILILVITWSGFTLGAYINNYDLDWVQMANPFISLFVILFLFICLALAFSMILPSSKSAGLVTGFLLITSYFISSLARIDENLESIDRFSPLKYYQGGAAIDGLDTQYFLWLLGLSVVLVALSWFFFIRRDLRFGGTGGFRLVFPKKNEPSK